MIHSKKTLDNHSKISTKNNFSYHSRNTQQLIMERLEEKHTLKDFIKVIDNKCKEWLNTKYAKWLRPETLFSVEHLDSYLQDEASTTEVLDMEK
ncbi:MAG: conserved phage C-terminal domain-containing protein, partial [Thaumarchaeota archaeon]|nr:conserved phage C-terminal domain-containing protein [Nitrososphaerota archaeon]